MTMMMRRRRRIRRRKMRRRRRKRKRKKWRLHTEEVNRELWSWGENPCCSWACCACFCCCWCRCCNSSKVVVVDVALVAVPDSFLMSTRAWAFPSTSSSTSAITTNPASSCSSSFTTTNCTGSIIIIVRRSTWDLQQKELIIGPFCLFLPESLIPHPELLCSWPSFLISKLTRAHQMKSSYMRICRRESELFKGNKMRKKCIAFFTLCVHFFLWVFIVRFPFLLLFLLMECSDNVFSKRRDSIFDASCHDQPVAWNSGVILGSPKPAMQCGNKVLKDRELAIIAKGGRKKQGKGKGFHLRCIVTHPNTKPGWWNQGCKAAIMSGEEEKKE